MFSPELRERAESLVARYPVGRSALLPLLHLVQAQDGYVSDDGIGECAQLLGLTKAEVNAVATFYTMYKRAPMGRHLVSVCTNFSCKVRGGQQVYDRLSQRLGVQSNETTADGAITLEHAECLGNCEGAPIVTVDYFNYELVDPDMAVELVERLIAGEVPPPTRGYASPGIREVEYRLAGLGPLLAVEPGAVPDQTTASDAAPEPATVGPGYETDAGPAEFQASEGAGAEQQGPSGLEPDSGSGGHDYGPSSEDRDQPTEETSEAADEPGAGDRTAEGSSAQDGGER